MFDVMTMLSDTALTEQLLSCQESKIEFIIQQVICCFTVVRSLLFLTGEWIGLLRPRLDLEKARPWPWGCLALASNWSGLGLEHSVLESIPATTWCQRHSSHTVKATALRRLWRRSTMTCCLLQTLANWPNWSNWSDLTDTVDHDLLQLWLEWQFGLRGVTLHWFLSYFGTKTFRH